MVDSVHGGSTAWDASGTEINTRAQHILLSEDLIMKLFQLPFFLFHWFK